MGRDHVEIRSAYWIVAALIIAFQFGQRPALTPAETLLEPVVLKALVSAAAQDDGRGAGVIEGSDKSAGEILVSCENQGCAATRAAGLTIRNLIQKDGLSPPARSIRFVPARNIDFPNAKVALDVVDGGQAALVIERSPWSLATIADEVVEIFARQAGPIDVKPMSNIGRNVWPASGIPTVRLSGGAGGQPAFTVAASAYFLATLPNAGAEPLLSFLTVGAHARLAEDGRRAVAMMGLQQRAGTEVLILMGQAIEREQRRIRSFTAFMPSPVDPGLQSRLADMEKGVTTMWTSLGITSSPFVPAAERIRGRGGDDQRVPRWVKPRVVGDTDVTIEICNFIDGKRTISDIRDAVSAEFGPIALAPVVEYLEQLSKNGVVAIK